MSNSALLKLSDQYQINEDSFMRTTLRTVPKRKTSRVILKKEGRSEKKRKKHITVRYMSSKDNRKDWASIVKAKTRLRETQRVNN